MKKLIFSFLITGLLLSVYSCLSDVPVSGIELSQNSVELIEGQSVQLDAKVLPKDATYMSIVWTSSDPAVASVENGKVTALKVGDAVITAQVGDCSATCTVKVNPVPVTSITLDKESFELFVGESFTLTATVQPDNATDKSIVWTSSDPAVASVENGKVTALKVGDAVITAQVGDCSAKSTVKVKIEGDNEELEYEEWSK